MRSCVRREVGIVVQSHREVCQVRFPAGLLILARCSCVIAENTGILISGFPNQRGWLICTERLEIQRRGNSGEIREEHRLQRATCVAVALVVLVIFPRLGALSYYWRGQLGDLQGGDESWKCCVFVLSGNTQLSQLSAKGRREPSGAQICWELRRMKDFSHRTITGVSRDQVLFMVGWAGWLVVRYR